MFTFIWWLSFFLFDLIEYFMGIFVGAFLSNSISMNVNSIRKQHIFIFDSQIMVSLPSPFGNISIIVKLITKLVEICELSRQCFNGFWSLHKECIYIHYLNWKQGLFFSFNFDIFLLGTPEIKLEKYIMQSIKLRTEYS